MACFMFLQVDYGTFDNRKTDGTTLRMDVTSSLSKDVVFVPSGTSVEALEVYTGKKVRTFAGHFKLVTGCYYNSAFQVTSLLFKIKF